MFIQFLMNYTSFLYMEPVLLFGGNGLQKKLLNDQTGIMQVIKSFGYALNGFKICFLNELNFRIHLLLTVVALSLAIVFGISAMEWIVLGFCIAFVLTMELINTAIEKLCDVVSMEIQPGIKKVKDITAAAVLVSAMFSLLAGIIIFLPRIIIFFKTM